MSKITQTLDFRSLKWSYSLTLLDPNSVTNDATIGFIRVHAFLAEASPHTIMIEVFESFYLDNMVIR